jgi:hypothetical protein
MEGALTGLGELSLLFVCGYRAVDCFMKFDVRGVKVRGARRGLFIVRLLHLETTSLYRSI